MSQVFDVEQQEYSPGFHVAENYAFKSERGLTRKVVEQISEMKGEPDWMRKFRLKSLDLFEKRNLRIQSGSPLDRKSTRLNSSHDQISYAVFCLKKKKKKT